MSRTFHYNLWLENQKAIKERRILRKSKRLLGETLTGYPIQAFSWEHHIEAIQMRSQLISHTIDHWNSAVEDAFFEGKLDREFWELCSEDITPYTDKTREMVDKVLQHNPTFTPLYLWVADVPLLSYRPDTNYPITDEERHRIRIRMWWILYSLYPPKEEIESIQSVHAIVSNISEQIRRTEWYIHTTADLVTSGLYKKL